MTDCPPQPQAAPRTEAGRSLVRWSNERGYDLHGQAIAIEAEGFWQGVTSVEEVHRPEPRAVAEPPLDVERLAKAGRRHQASHDHSYWNSACFRELAAEYARLAARSADE